jgi:hypothetical protein
MTDDREFKVQQAIAVVRERNFDRYGIDAVDENYIRGLPDCRLDRIDPEFPRL